VAVPAGMFVLGINENGEICGAARNPRHRSLSWLKVWELVELASELGSSLLVVVLRAEGPARRPTAHELAVFGDLAVRARRAGITVVDCLVWRADDWWSLRELNEGRISA
jgi:hypothetical protein